ncbi:MAG: GlsB/YeaQ/YmgE family stress response membrane protein [Actinomycetota bacterium]
MSWLGLIIPGLLAGALARLFVPTGRQFGCLGTILLGIVGSLVGGTIASVLAGDGFDISTAGFVGSVVGAMLILLLMRSNDNRSTR